MRTTTRAILGSIGAATLLVGPGAAPGSAQFERALPTGESHDAIDLAVTPDGREWWVAETDGQVATAPLGEPQVSCEPPDDVRGYVRGMDTTPSGEGYWLATTYGEVIACGDAVDHGDLVSEGIVPNHPIVGIAATSDGGGYWMAASDGGVFTYGNAAFRGSAAAFDLNAPVVGLDATGDDGYWLVATDGGIFTFGDARFHGSAGGIQLNKPIVDMSATATGDGYLLLGEDGGVFAYGDARFHGSRHTSDDPVALGDPFVGIEHAWGHDGYFITDNAGIVQRFPTETSNPEEIEVTPGFPGSGPTALLTDVRMGATPTLDRFVFEFRNRVPEYAVRHIAPPVLEQPSSRPIDVEGTTFIAITAAMASGVDLSGDEPRQTYTGPDRIEGPGTSVITEAVETEDWEGHLSWVIGLERRATVDVFTLQGPPRVVVDVLHP